MSTYDEHSKQFEVSYTELNPGVGDVPSTHEAHAKHLERPYVEPPPSPPTTHDFQAAWYTVTD